MVQAELLDEVALRKGFRNLWRFLGTSLRYWRMLVAGFLTAIARMALPLYMPILLKELIDLIPSLSSEEAIARTWRFAYIVGGILVVHVLVVVGRFYFPQAAASSVVRDIRYRLYRHIQRLSLGFHSRRPTGKVVSRLVSDVNMAQSAFQNIFIIAVQNIMQAATVSAVMLFIDWKWALVAFATVPFCILASRLMTVHIRKASEKTLEAMAEMSGYVNERFGMIREIQSFTAERHEQRAVLHHAEDIRKYSLRRATFHGCLVASAEFTRFAGLLAVLVFGVYRVTDGAATIGALSLFYFYTQMLMQPLNNIANVYANIVEAKAAADRVYDFLDTTPAVQDVPGARTIRLAKAPAVRFENVRFAYPDENPIGVIHDITLDIHPGARVVLAGPSGSGKSTLMMLLPRFYDIQQGRILIDGKDIRKFTSHSLRQATGIVPQEPVLFSGTIRENILYGKLNATDEEVAAAARAANAEDFILQQPQGYDTICGERGVNLSGGQVQRISIARAFLKDPKILIMDEATSNLDAHSETLVLQALDRLAQGRTTFIIAHRLSVARKADMIVVLAGGRIAETGTHEHLLEANGRYADLWRQQMMGIDI